MIQKKLSAAFYQSPKGNEPVKEWLLELSKEDRRLVGNDIATLEFGWPIGMPLCRSLTGIEDLWEIRTNLTNKKIARVIFCIRPGNLVLLHAFIKKSQKTPQKEIKVAEKRARKI